MQPTRREVLGAGLGLLAGGIAGGHLEGQEPPAQSQKSEPANGSPGDEGWIDAHVHVWTDDLNRYPLATGFSRDAMAPPRFTPDDLLGHCRPAGVNRIVLVQMNFYGFDHRYMLHAMQHYPGVFSGIGLVDYLGDSVPADVAELADAGVRGIRIHSLGDAEQWVTHPGMQQLWTEATRQGMAVCPLINPHDIRWIDQLCQKYPDTKVVVDHFARIGIDGAIDASSLDALCRLAQFPRVYLKTSAFYALGAKRPPYIDLLPMIRRVCDAFGPQRLMWGSDCPFQVQGQHTYDASLALIRDHADFLTPGEQRSILRGTAETLFFSA